MAAVPQSDDSYQQLTSEPSRLRGSRSNPTRWRAERQVVRELPQAPSWLKLLLTVQHASSIFTFLLIAAALTTYSWTVYIQQHWGHTYSKLEGLQKQERQLMAANEVLKNQMAQQAENPAMGLVAPTLNSTIFLAPAPQRPDVKPEATALDPELVPERPLGY